MDFSGMLDRDVIQFCFRSSLSAAKQWWVCRQSRVASTTKTIKKITWFSFRLSASPRLSADMSFLVSLLTDRLDTCGFCGDCDFVGFLTVREVLKTEGSIASKIQRDCILLINCNLSFCSRCLRCTRCTRCVHYATSHQKKHVPNQYSSMQN